MWRFLPYVLKGLWRHRTRTMLTVSGTAVALFVFCFVGAVQEGLARLTEDRQAQRTLVVFQENRFCPTSSKLPQDYARQIEKLPGIKGATPIKVFTNNCRASLDVIVFNGFEPAELRKVRQLQLLSGDWSQFDSLTDAAVVGQAVAQRRGLRAGQKFSIGDIRVQIVGVFRSSVSAEDHFIYTHLDFLQRARGASSVGTVTQFEVQLNDQADPDTVAAAIDAGFRSGPVATTTRPKGVFQADTLADLAELIGLAHWLGYACVGLVLALVATTTVMAVQDRIKEHAVLQTLGMRPGGVFKLVVTESVMQSLLGGLIGVGMGMLILAVSNMAVGAEGVTISFLPSWRMAHVGVAVSLTVGLLAGLAPAWQASRTEIVFALRQA